MEDWLPYRPVFLDETVRHDGLGDTLGGSGLCPNCSTRAARFKCNDCYGGVMRCSSCIVSIHQELPFHRLQVRMYPVPRSPELTPLQAVEW